MRTGTVELRLNGGIAGAGRGSTFLGDGETALAEEECVVLDERIGVVVDDTGDGGVVDLVLKAGDVVHAVLPPVAVLAVEDAVELLGDHSADSWAKHGLELARVAVLAEERDERHWRVSVDLQHQDT